MALDLRARLRRFTRNPQYKLLSLAIALGTWYYVQEGETGEAKVRAELTWLMPAGIVATDALPPSATLTLRGTRANLRRASEAHLTITVDLSENTVGTDVVEMSAYPVLNLTNGVGVVGWQPAQIPVELDQLLSHKVRLVAPTVGEPRGGYSAKVTELDPSVIEIEGPRVVLQGLSEVSTEPIDISKLTQDTEVTVDVELPPLVRMVDDVTPVAKVEVESRLDAREFTDIPVQVRSLYGWVPSPGTVRVTVEGPAGAVAKVDKQRITAWVFLPDNPEKKAYTAPFGPTDGLRMEVWPNRDDVKVVTVKPNRVEVTAP